MPAFARWIVALRPGLGRIRGERRASDRDGHDRSLDYERDQPADREAGQTSAGEPQRRGDELEQSADRADDRRPGRPAADPQVDVEVVLQTIGTAATATIVRAGGASSCARPKTQERAAHDSPSVSCILLRRAPGARAEAT